MLYLIKLKKKLVNIIKEQVQKKRKTYKLQLIKLLTSNTLTFKFKQVQKLFMYIVYILYYTLYYIYIYIIQIHKI